MTDQERNVMQFALDALEDARCLLRDWRNIPDAYKDEIESLRQALAQNPLDIADRAYFAGKQDGIAETLAQPEQTCCCGEPDALGVVHRKDNPCYVAQPEQEPDYGIDRGAWSDVPDATKWVDELRGDEDSEKEPVAWIPIEQMHPQAKAIDILMGDGSILCAVLPQFDGDLWWGGSGTGEKFIDPNYANVTHWRIHSDTSTPSKPDVNQELVEALEGLMPYIATQATGCYGDKCREPWCFSCNGADDAFAAAEKGQDACAKASEVLAKHKEQA